MHGLVVVLSLFLAGCHAEVCTWTNIEDAFDFINNEHGRLALPEGWAKGREAATGQISESVYPHTGQIMFPDDRTFTFVYYPDEAVIYWAGDKGSAKSVWEGEKAAPHSHLMPFCRFSFYKSCRVEVVLTPIEDAFGGMSNVEGELALTNWSEGREDATGSIDTSSIPHTGLFNFPDDRPFTFFYYPDEAVIYWGADKGSTEKFWEGVKNLWTDIDDAFEESDKVEVSADCNGDIGIKFQDGLRPAGAGWVNRGNYPQTGAVNFPDDRTFSFFYYPDEAKIYWDGDKGSTQNIWTGSHA